MQGPIAQSVACLSVCLSVCVRACVRACGRAGGWACMRACASLHSNTLPKTTGFNFLWKFIRTGVRNLCIWPRFFLVFIVEPRGARNFTLNFPCSAGLLAGLTT